MTFDIELARRIGVANSTEAGNEIGLAESYANVCAYLADNPSSLSLSGKSKPDLKTEDGLIKLAGKYFSSFRSSNFPSTPNTVPDEMVSVVLQYAYDHPKQDCARIKLQHQQSMAAENCVGALLERYLDSVLRQYGWHWCCGSVVKAIDFVRKNNDDSWLSLQIKNRDNSENSSSSAIRKNTIIEKWFRTFSRTGKTNWDNLPPLMQGYGLSEDGFLQFVRTYLKNKKPKSK